MMPLTGWPSRVALKPTTAAFGLRVASTMKPEARARVPDTGWRISIGGWVRAVAVALGLAVALGVVVEVAVGIGESVAVGTGELVAVGRGEAVRVEVGTRDGVEVGLGVAVWVALGEVVGVGCEPLELSVQPLAARTTEAMSTRRPGFRRVK